MTTDGFIATRRPLQPASGQWPAQNSVHKLAWFIRRKPRGLIAASIQYGHAYTQML